MKEKISLQVACLNVVLLIVYLIVFVGAGLKLYSIWPNSVTGMLAFVMMWSFYLPPLVENPGPLTMFIGMPFFQWVLPIITSLVGMYLNRKKYLTVHLGLLIVIIASLMIAMDRGIYLITT
jgi:hypothetical protein